MIQQRPREAFVTLYGGLSLIDSKQALLFLGTTHEVMEPLFCFLGGPEPYALEASTLPRNAVYSRAGGSACSIGGFVASMLGALLFDGSVVTRYLRGLLCRVRSSLSACIITASNSG